MAKLGIQQKNGDVQYINVVDPATAANNPTPEESFSDLVDNQEKINQVITIDEDGGTINDHGYVDLSQMTALKDVNPLPPGAYPTASVQVYFTEEEKTNLQLLIKKLASVAHTHTLSANYSENTIPYDCYNMYCRTNCENNTNHPDHSNHGDHSDNNWW